MQMNEMTDDTPVQVGDEILTYGEYQRRQKTVMDGVYSGFAKMRDLWVQHRAQSGVETRWKKARALYYGMDTENESAFKETLTVGPRPRASSDGAPRSRVVINIVRPKVDQAIARMCEILLPVDDRNWAIRPTPIPSLVQKMLGDKRQTVVPGTSEPTGMTADDEAQLVVRAAREASEAMQESIDDSLTECDYNGESRAGIEDGVCLGTMIMKGPFPGRKSARVWMPRGDGTNELIIEHETVPKSKHVDPWDVYFDPSCGNDHQRGRGVWEKRMVNRKELRALAGLPGYDEDVIREILLLPPTRIRVAEGRVTRNYASDDSYELWEYHGEIDPEDMSRLTARMKGYDPLHDVEFGVCVMINDRIISAMPSWIEDGTLPYDVWNWRKSDDSPYGFGLPDEMENQQRVVTAAWRQVMDNARNSGGSQVVVRKGVQPQDGNYNITPNKAWVAGDDVDDVQKAFGVFDFPSHLDELLNIAKFAMEVSDQETSMPQLLNGNQGTGPTPETVGGMVMLYNNANTVLRLRVKQYDDSITRPHIRRYYDWKMANDPDPKIKGDFEIDARGASALVERDIQNQATLNLAQITANERYAPLMKADEELKAILKAFRFAPDQLMKSKSELAADAESAAQNPPQDPRVISAQMNLQAKEMDIADRKEQRQFEAARNDSDQQLKVRTLDYNQSREQAEYDIAMGDQAIKRDTALLKIDSEERRTAAELQAEERLNALRLDQDRQLFNAEAALRIRTGQGI